MSSLNGFSGCWGRETDFTLGQYHWVSEFAPPGQQKILSYASGWMSTLSWVAAQTSGPFLTVTLIEVMINVTNPAFTFSSWQYTLLALAFLISVIFLNTWAAPILPWLQSIALFGHVIGFLVVIITLWVCAPKGSAEEVFTNFSNESGWSLGGAILLNQVNILYTISGADTSVHISEEVGDASVVVPRAMFWSFILNFVRSSPRLHPTILTETGFGTIDFDYYALLLGPSTGCYRC